MSATAHNHKKVNITSALAEIQAPDGTNYQMQIAFISDPKLFLAENAIMFSESVAVAPITETNIN